jgi:hypothetical protein
MLPHFRLDRGSTTLTYLRAVDGTSELVLIEAWIAEHGCTHCPPACCAVTRDLFTPVLVAQKIVAMKLPPAQRVSWLVLWLARMHEERRAYQAGMSVKQYRGRVALVAPPTAAAWEPPRIAGDAGLSRNRRPALLAAVAGNRAQATALQGLLERYTLPRRGRRRSYSQWVA